MHSYRNSVDQRKDKEGYVSERRIRRYSEFNVDDDGEVIGMPRCVCARNPPCEYPLPRMTDIIIFGG